MKNSIQTAVDNPFLLKMYYCFQSELRLYFFTEFIAGGDLMSNMVKNGRFKEQQVKFYAAQLVIAFGSIHRDNIIHRDLKPENVLLGKDGYIVLADFGLAKILEDEYDIGLTQCGTPGYYAPEIIRGDPQTFTVDWWTLGILVYELMCGFSPYKDPGSMNSRIVWPDPHKHKIYI